MLLFFAFRSQAQDAHFTQLDKTISYLNPAMTGNFDGFAKITAQNRVNGLIRVQLSQLRT